MYQPLSPGATLLAQRLHASSPSCCTSGMQKMTARAETLTATAVNSVQAEVGDLLVDGQATLGPDVFLSLSPFNTVLPPSSALGGMTQSAANWPNTTIPSTSSPSVFTPASFGIALAPGSYLVSVSLEVQWIVQPTSIQSLVLAFGTVTAAAGSTTVVTGGVVPPNQTLPYQATFFFQSTQVAPLLQLLVSAEFGSGSIVAKNGVVRALRLA